MSDQVGDFGEESSVGEGGSDDVVRVMVRGRVSDRLGWTGKGRGDFWDLL